MTRKDLAKRLEAMQHRYNVAERLSTQSPKISAYHLGRLEVKAGFYEMITQTDESE